jgi:hypothetical protein
MLTGIATKTEHSSYQQWSFLNPEQFNTSDEPEESDGGQTQIFFLAYSIPTYL